MDRENIESRYPKLEVPKLDSKIPAHLLNRLSDQERWLVGTLSLIDQKVDWLMSVQSRANEIEREIDVRLTKVERFTGKWAVVGAGCLLVVTAFLGSAARAIFSHIWP